MNVVVVGVRYAGLATTASLSDINCSVASVDGSSEAVVAFRHGELPVVEPGLGPLRPTSTVMPGAISSARDVSRLVGGSARRG